MRSPSTEIVQTDPYGIETACIAQLLYIHGDFETYQFKAFNTAIGWQSGEGDTISGNFYYVLRAGYCVHEITPFDPALILARGEDYLKEIWRQNGETQQAIKTELPRVYPLARKRALFKMKAISDFQNRYSREPRAGTPEDVFTRLRAGWQIVCHIEKDNDLRHVLITRILNNELYEIFDPMSGIAQMHPREIIYPDVFTLQCFKKIS